MIIEFEKKLSPEQRETFASLTSPVKIQEYLDATPYTSDSFNRSPLRVMCDRQAHCLDGGLFAAAALRLLGFPPRIVDLLPEPGTDDDHILAIFEVNGRLGAVAKSNFVGLRYREPVFRGLHELVMSYFEAFYNVEGKKTLRGYTAPVNLAKYDALGWMWEDAGVDLLEKRLYTLYQYPLLTREMVAALTPVDKLTYETGLMVANPAGLYKPKH